MSADPAQAALAADLTFPDCWDDVTVGDLGEIVAGGTPSRTSPSFWDGHIPWVTPGEITRLKDRYLWATAERITKAGLASSAARLLPPGSILVTSRATLGERAIAAVLVTTNQGFKNIVPNDESDSLFTYYLIATCRRQMVNLASGTTFLEISKSDFERIRTRRPLPDEQRRIAAVLDLVDAAIEKTAAVIGKLKQIRAGLLHDLLTRGLDHNGQRRDPTTNPHHFKPSPLGHIPKEWCSRSLNQLVPVDRPIVYGILMPGRGFREGIPVIKVKDIHDGRIDESSLLLTDPRIDEAYSRSRVLPGDLLLTIRGTVGRMAIVPDSLSDANITQDTARISLADAYPKFIARWLEMEQSLRFVAVHTLGVAVQGINLRDVRRIPVPRVPLAEQEAIIAIIDAHESRIEAENDSLAKLHQLKAGLMSDLLTGRVRVPADLNVDTNPIEPGR